MPRPKTNINWKQVDEYLHAHCDGASIAAFLGIHANTLYEACKETHKISFSEYSSIKRGEGKDLLRHKMYKQAMEGDRTLQIWLSKQYLDMREQTSIIQSIESLPEIVLLPANTAKPPVYDEADVVDPLEWFWCLNIASPGTLMVSGFFVAIILYICINATEPDIWHAWRCVLVAVYRPP